MKIRISEASQYLGQHVTLHLTLATLRDQKHVQFLLAHDTSGQMQLVIDKSCCAPADADGPLLAGSSFAATGRLVASAQSKTAGIEMQVETIEVYSRALAFPITQDSSLDLRLTHRVVDLKAAKWQLMLRLRSAFEFACREYALGRGYTEIHTPKLMGGASESGAQVFEVRYFDTTAFLAQSPQFYKQLGIASGLEGVFEIGPVFRAEDSRSSRHLTEFTGLDVEFAWVFDVKQVMEFETAMLQYAFSALAKFAAEVKLLFAVELPIVPTVHSISLTDAKALLSAAGLPLRAQDDLSDEAERQLHQILGHDLIFVFDYPIEKRPFYHYYDRERGTTRSFDLIFKGIEITTGAVREHRYDMVCQQAQEKGVALQSITHYLDNFRYGCPPHGGFGLGIERVIAKLLGLSNVKEAAFVARDPDRLVP